MKRYPYLYILLALLLSSCCCNIQNIKYPSTPIYVENTLDVFNNPKPLNQLTRVTTHNMYVDVVSLGQTEKYISLRLIDMTSNPTFTAIRVMPHESPTMWKYVVTGQCSKQNNKSCNVRNDYLEWYSSENSGIYRINESLYVENSVEKTYLNFSPSFGRTISITAGINNGSLSPMILSRFNRAHYLSFWKYTEQAWQSNIINDCPLFPKIQAYNGSVVLFCHDRILKSKGEYTKWQKLNYPYSTKDYAYSKVFNSDYDQNKYIIHAIKSSPNGLESINYSLEDNNFRLIIPNLKSVFWDIEVTEQGEMVIAANEGLYYVAKGSNKAQLVNEKYQCFVLYPMEGGVKIYSFCNPKASNLKTDFSQTNLSGNESYPFKIILFSSNSGKTWSDVTSNILPISQKG